MEDHAPKASPKMNDYFGSIEDGLTECIGIAKEARKKGYDPRTDIEIPIASDLADRVEALMGYKGVAARLRELGKEMSREEVSLKIGDDFVAGMFGETDKVAILDHAIRTSMALLTEGVVAAPTEGIGNIGIGKNDDGTEYLKIAYAGPIRSAGGTAQALSVLVGDYVRKALKMNRYIPRDEEVERYVEEIKKYNSISSLQYLPPDDDLRHIVRNCPVCIDGEPTEQVEVSGYRNLERIETNVIRGGMCLVIAEGMGLKAPKIQKIVRKVHMDGWEWLDALVSGAAAKPSEEEEKDDSVKIKPKDKFIHDVLGGRPIFAYPMRKGGFRLRYGRSRNTGFAGAGFSPATLHLLGDYLAVGTQMKVERPGKAVGVVPVDTIEGPTIRLLNGDVVRIDTIREALPLMKSISSIIDVGEMLVSFGEFLENNHVLVPASYCHEWWIQENDWKERPKTEKEAIALCKDGYFLHPDFTYLWDDISCERLVKLSKYVEELAYFSKAGVTGTATDPSSVKTAHDAAYAAAQNASSSSQNSAESQNTLLDGHGGAAEDGGGTPSESDNVDAADKRKVFPYDAESGKGPNTTYCPAAHVDLPAPDDGQSRFVSADTPVLCIPNNPEIKEIMEELLVLHKVRNGMLVVDRPYVFLACLGLDENKKRIKPLDDEAALKIAEEHRSNALELAMHLSGFKMRSKAGTRIGGRMGRPGKSKPREMTGKPHVLFPVGVEGGSRRSFQEASKSREADINSGDIEKGFAIVGSGTSGVVEMEVGLRECEVCGKETFRNICDCGGHTLPVYRCPRCATRIEPGGSCPKCGDVEGTCIQRLKVDIKGEYNNALEHLGMRDSEIKLLKGVKGMSSAEKCVEVLEKGLIRAKNNLCVFKDGTVRYDMIDLPLTHFRPSEISVPWSRLVELGYDYDVYGKPLRSDSQVLELKCQDILVSEDCGNWLCNVAKFMDEMMVELYGMSPYYNAKKKEDLVGQLLIGLAPHTSAGVLVRLIGFTQALVGYGHPYFHAAKRRNCDGDEDCVMLLLDGLINFSKAFLPATRGGSMDAPLVLTKRIDPKEVDGESHNVDACDHYPLRVYMGGLEYANPKDISKEIDNVDSRLGSPAQYEGIMFTHDTSDISAGPHVSSYNTIKSMSDKLDAQLELGRIIRAVDESDLAERILKTHFLRDIMGNLNSFSKQKLRCTKCGAKYRRMPLAGKCTVCGNSLNATIYEGSIKKYLEPSIRMCEEYDISEYTRQRVEVLNLFIKSTFGEQQQEQMDLSSFM